MLFVFMLSGPYLVAVVWHGFWIRRLVSKYKPTMPSLVVVVPRLKTNQLKWSFTGAFQARQCLAMRGLFPMLADPRNPVSALPNLSMLYCHC